jgi:hypothetical protein
MRLIPVDSNVSIPTCLRCSDCGEWRNSGELYADLDGAPFQAYYCRTDLRKLGGIVVKACANKLIEEGAQVIEREAI